MEGLRVQGLRGPGFWVFGSEGSVCDGLGFRD